MLTAAYELKVNVAPNIREHVIGIGDETRAIAVEISNLGKQPLKSLTLKYQAGAGGQWFDLVTNKAGFTTQTTVLRAWNGDNPYDLKPQKKAVLYLDVSEIWAIKLDMQCVGERNVYPLPDTKINVNAYAIKHLGIIGGAVAPVSQTGIGGVKSEPGTINTSDPGRLGKGTISGASSVSMMNTGTKSGLVRTAKGESTVPPGGTAGWSPSDMKTVGDIYYDATGTTFWIAFLDGQHVEGEDRITNPVAITEESGQSLTDESGQPLTA